MLYCTMTALGRMNHTVEPSTDNIVLREGEMAYDTTSKLFKIGDGTTAWNSLYKWRDIEFPLNAIRINPATSKPDYDATNLAYAFDKDSTETVTCGGHMQHDWVTGSVVRPHVHWIQSAAGTVVWQLEYRFADIGDAVGDFGTPVTAQDGYVDYTSGTIHQVTVFDEIDMSGYGIGCLMQFKLSRLGGDGDDDYNADALMFEFDLHIPIDSPGSKSEWTK